MNINRQTFTFNRAFWRIIALLLLVTLVMFSCNDKDSKKTPPQVIKGVLDVKNWDFTKNGPLNLHGEWTFFWNRFFTPKSFLAGQYNHFKPDYVQVPGIWNGFQPKLNQEKSLPAIKGEGFATYLLTINGLKEADQGKLAIKFVGAGTAYNLYFLPGASTKNPDSAAENTASSTASPLLKRGIIATTSQKAKPQNLSAIATISNHEPVNYIMVHVSNYHHSKGGIWESVQLGRVSDLTSEMIQTRSVAFLVLGVLLIMFIYHLGLFFARKNDWASLIFSFFCLDIFLRLFFSDKFASELLPHPSTLWFEFCFKIEYLTIYCGGPMFISFLCQVFKKEFNRWIEKILWGISLPFILLVIVTPTRIFSQSLNYYHLLFPIFGPLICWHLGRAVKHHRPGALISLSGFIIFFLMIINDILYVRGIIHTAFMTPYGFVAFIFAQSAILARLFANAHQQAEDLNVKLSAANQQLEQAYDKILEQEKERTIFFHNTSHELRTPLNGIIGFSYLLQHGKMGQISSNASEQIGKIKHLAESLKIQVNTILDLACSKRGTLEQTNSRIAIEQLIQESDLLAQGLLLEKKNATFQINRLFDEKKEHFFIGDQKKIIAILRNLLSNAFKFSQPIRNNQIILSLALTDQKELCIKVQDTGIGIPKEQLSKIFQEFKQVEGNSRRSFEGTGLGLTLVKKLVDLMEGKIAVDSEVSLGSTFSVIIPAQKNIDIADTPPESELLEPWQLDSQSTETSKPDDTFQDTMPATDEVTYLYNSENEKYTILVVDDNEINVEVLASVLTSCGFQVNPSYGGRDALEQVRRQSPDLLLLDLMMPEVSGEDVLKEIRADHSLCDLPIIIVTARASQEDRLLGLELGADDYLAKPIIFDELILRVRALLTRIELSKEITRQKVEAKKEQEIALTQAMVKAEKSKKELLGRAYDELNLAHQKLKETQSQLIQTSKLASMGEMIGNIAHQWRQPLSSWGAIMQDIKYAFEDGVLDKPYLDQVVEDAKQITFHMSKTIDDFRNFFKPDKIKKEFSLEKSLNNALNLIGAALKNNFIEVQIKVEEDIQIWGYPNEYEQVLFNLINNAKDALLEKQVKEPLIKIVLGVNQKIACVSVNDNAGGIDEEIIGRIFEPYFTTKEQGQGTGIGLYMSKTIIEKNMDGHLNVENTDIGARFTISLPIGKKEEPKDADNLEFIDRETNLPSQNAFSLLIKEQMGLANENRRLMGLFLVELKTITDQKPEIIELVSVLKHSIRDADRLISLDKHRVAILTMVLSKENHSHILARINQNLTTHNHKHPQKQLEVNFGIAFSDPQKPLSTAELLSQVEVDLKNRTLTIQTPTAQ